MPTEKPKKHMLFCEPCSYKRLVLPGDDASDLVEIPVSGVPGGSPTLDPVKGKAKDKPWSEQPRRFRCPKCGRAMRERDVSLAYAKAIEAKEKIVEKQKAEEARLQRIQDGKPHERKVGQ